MKILFVIDKLNMGGVSSSLINLLNYLDGKCECDLIVFSGKKPKQKDFPAGVHLVEPQGVLTILGHSQSEMKAISFPKWLFRAGLALTSKVFGGYFARKLLFLFVKKIEGYDAAISYTHDVTHKSLTTGCNQFVAEKVEAKKKVSFVHCDYSSFGGYHPSQIKTYRQFDYIACVSNACKKSFSSCFPEIEEKVISVENLTNTKKIYSLLDSNFEYDSGKTNFVTVCRLSEEKGISRAIDAFARLKESHGDFLWTVVGDGPDREELEKKTEELGLREHISFVGATSNPFYYMKNASFFLLPSFHEAAPMVFGESQAVGLPIITTATVSAKDLVEDKGIGIVCENSTDGIYDALKKVMENKTEVLKNISIDPAAVNKSAERDINQLLSDIEGETK